MRRFNMLWAAGAVILISACNLLNTPGAVDEAPVIDVAPEPGDSLDTTGPPIESTVPAMVVSDELAGTFWTLVSLDGTPVLADTQISLNFEPERLSGTACNGYGGAYAAGGGAISIRQVISTMMACMDPAGVMEQESAYFNLLGQVTQYSLSGSQLTLGTADQPSLLVFEAATPPPVSNAPEGWTSIRYTEFGFEISFPVDPEGTASTTAQPGESISERYDLPFTEGTNLQEKTLQIDARRGAQTCASPFAEGYAPGSFDSGSVNIAGLDWLREAGSDAGAGNFYDWISYSAAQGDVCVTLTLVLHSTNAQNYSPPLAEFDRAAESAVIEAIVVSFLWAG